MRKSLIVVGVLVSAILGGCQSTQTPVARMLSGAPKPKPLPGMRGQGRVPVEHGLDVDVAKIDPQPKEITVEDLLATRDKEAGSVDLKSYHNRRVAPFETTTFEVKGTLKSIKHEKDGDFYFVLQGKSGAQAIIEVPDPKLCVGSPLEPKITAAREALDAKYHPTAAVQSLNDEITVDGVGFLGSRRNPGSGTFGASVRLMPGTGIKFPSS